MLRRVQVARSRLEDAMYIEVKDLKKSYGTGDSKVQVLRGVTTEVEQGKMCVIHAVGVHHSGDSGGVVGAVRLKGAGAQGIGKALALTHQVINGIGLVAVGHDMGLAQRQHRIVNNEAGVLQLCGVRCDGADAAALGHGVKHAVAAVLAASHDKVADKHLPSVRSPPSCDACGQLTDCVFVYTDAIPFAMFILAIEVMNEGTDQYATRYPLKTPNTSPTSKLIIIAAAIGTPCAVRL